MMWLGNKQIGWIHWLKAHLKSLRLGDLRLGDLRLGSLQGTLHKRIAWVRARQTSLSHNLMRVLKSIKTIGQEPLGLEMIRATHIASADTLWQIVNNLADLETWHPLVTGTNAPRGQQAKPGLMYRTMSRYLPLSTQVFVERVLPGELVSMRLFPLPGLQERVSYRIVSTLCGTCVLYSITLSGWLSPFAWPVVKPQVTKVAAALVAAAEMETTEQWRAAGGQRSGQIHEREKRGGKRRSHQKADIFE